jgi:hypothetical protein
MNTPHPQPNMQYDVDYNDREKLWFVYNRVSGLPIGLPHSQFGPVFEQCVALNRSTRN